MSLISKKEQIEDDFISSEPLIEKTFTERIKSNYKFSALCLIAFNYLNDGLIGMRILTMRSLLFEDPKMTPEKLGLFITIGASPFILKFFIGLFIDLEFVKTKSLIAFFSVVCFTS